MLIFSFKVDETTFDVIHLKKKKKKVCEGFAVKYYNRNYY